MDEQILLEWNPWWALEFQSKFTGRDAVEPFTSWLDRKEIITLSGARRSGKTTLMYIMIQHLLRTVPKENILFIKCDDDRVDEEGLIDQARETHRELFNPSGKVYLFLDEVQELEGWDKTVKRIYDLIDGGGAWSGLKIILTGSRLMKDELATTLAGRYVTIDVYPFSFREFLESRGLEASTGIQGLAQKDEFQFLLREYIEWGGFPEIVLENDGERKRELLGFYSDSILYRDVVKRSGLARVDKLEMMKNLALTNVSNLMSFNKVAKQIGVSPDTVSSYFRAMENANYIFTVPLHAFSLSKQQMNPKKVYCIDTGIRNAVGFRFSSDIGRLYENIVFVHLRRQGREVYYWKPTKNGTSGKNGEVDFVVKEGNRITKAIQVCYDLELAYEREITALVKACEEFDLEEGIVVTGRIRNKENHDGKVVRFIPLWEWLLLED
jgi:uncharacterized protein